MRIIGPPSSTFHAVESWCRQNAQPLFQVEMLPALWDQAERYLIDPVGAVAQSHKETGAGAFGGQVLPKFYNTCGLKIRHLGLFKEADGDKPLAHQMFPSWEIGAMAHMQHLRAYAGWPVLDPIVDPRYNFVVGRHRCEHFADLGTKWAPAKDYGTQVEEIAKRIRGW